jgi:hypothetical protein
MQAAVTKTSPGLATCWKGIEASQKAEGQEGQKHAIVCFVSLMLILSMDINMLSSMWSSTFATFVRSYLRIPLLFWCMPKFFDDCAQGNLHRFIDGTHGLV